MGGQAENRQGAASTSAKGGRGLGQAKPTLASQRPVGSSSQQGSRTCQLLRYYRQLQIRDHVRLPGPTGMAQVAEPAFAEGEHQLGEVWGIPQALSTDSSNEACPVASLSSEEPDAGNPHVRFCGGPRGQPLGLPDLGHAEAW